MILDWEFMSCLVSGEGIDLKGTLGGHVGKVR